MYLESACSAADVISAAPGPGWGIVVTTVGRLRLLGFIAVREPVPGDALLGHAHVSVFPPRYDEQGQIPRDLRALLAAASQWLSPPGEA
jgi:hypothetical protein